MPDFSMLGIRLDTSDVRKGLKDLDNLSKAGNSATKSLNKTTTAGKKTSKSQESLASSTLGTTKAFKSMTSALSVLALFGTAKKITELADKMSLLDSRIKISTKSAVDYTKAQKMLVDMSLRTGTSFEANTTIFVRTNKAIESMGGNINTTARFTETLAKSLVISGTTAGETTSVIRQMSQALASGVLRGDEFNSISENGARIQQVLTESLGVTAGKLRTMAEHGKLTSTKVINALLKQSKIIDAEYARMPKTVGRALENINTAFGQYIMLADRGSGATAGIADNLDAVAKNMTPIIDSLVTLGTVAAVLVFGGIAKGAVTYVKHTNDMIKISRAHSEALKMNAAVDKANAISKAESEVASATAMKNATERTVEKARVDRDAVIAEGNLVVANLEEAQSELEVASSLQISTDRLKANTEAINANNTAKSNLASANIGVSTAINESATIGASISSKEANADKLYADRNKVISELNRLDEKREKALIAVSKAEDALSIKTSKGTEKQIASASAKALNTKKTLESINEKRKLTETTLNSVDAQIQNNKALNEVNPILKQQSNEAVKHAHAQQELAQQTANTTQKTLESVDISKEQIEIENKLESARKKASQAQADVNYNQSKKIEADGNLINTTKSLEKNTEKLAAATANLKAQFNKPLKGVEAIKGFVREYGALNIAISTFMAWEIGNALGKWARGFQEVRVFAAIAVGELMLALDAVAFRWEKFLILIGRSDKDLAKLTTAYEKDAAAMKLLVAQTVALEASTVKSNQGIIDAAAAQKLLTETKKKAADIAKAHKKTIEDEFNSLVSEYVQLTSNARVYEVYRLSKKGVVGEEQAQQMALWDLVAGLRAKKDAMGGVTTSYDDQSGSIQDVIDALIDENLQLSIGERAYKKHTLEQEGLAGATLQYAMALWDANKAQIATNKSIEDNKKITDSMSESFGKIAAMSPFKKAKDDLTHLTTDELQDGINSLIGRFEELQTKASELKLSGSLDESELQGIEEKLKGITNQVSNYISEQNKLNKVIEDNIRNQQLAHDVLLLERTAIGSVNDTLLEQTQRLNEVAVAKEKARLIDMGLSDKKNGAVSPDSEVGVALAAFEVNLNEVQLNEQLVAAQGALDDATLSVGLESVDIDSDVLDAVTSITNIILDFMEKQREIGERSEAIKHLEEEIRLQKELSLIGGANLTSVDSAISSTTDSFSQFKDVAMDSAESVREIVLEIVKLNDAASNLPSSSSDFTDSGGFSDIGGAGDVGGDEANDLMSENGIKLGIDEDDFQSKLDTLFSSIQTPSIDVSIGVDKKGIKKDLISVDKQFGKTMRSLSGSKKVINDSLTTPIGGVAAEANKTSKSVVSGISDIGTASINTASDIKENPLFDTSVQSNIDNASNSWSAFNGNIEDSHPAISSVGKDIKGASSELGAFGTTADDLQASALNAVDMVGDVFGVMADMYASQAAAQEEGSRAQAELQKKSLAMTLVSATVNGVAAVIRSLATGGWPEAIITAAAVAAQLATIGGQMASIGSGPPELQETQGTGTVLGDDSAVSESLGNSIEVLEDYADIGNEHTSKMLISLQSIDSGIKSLGLGLFRSETYGDFASDPTGYVEPQAKVYGNGGAANTAINLAKSTHNFIFGKYEEDIKDVGILFGKRTGDKGEADTVLQDFGQVIDDGLESHYFAKVDTYKKVLGLFKTSTKTQNPVEEMQDSLGRWFDDIMFNMIDATTQGMQILTDDTEKKIIDNIRDVDLDIGLNENNKLSLKDMDLEEMNAAIAGVFSRVSDDLVTDLIPEMLYFQQVGEGLFETFSRVSAETESAGTALSQLGYEAVNYTDVLNKQNDVAPQVVKQTIALNEEYSNISDIMQYLQGDAQELVGTYLDLVAAQKLVLGVGLNEETVDSELIGASGGLNELTSNLETFFESYFTEQEQLDVRMSQMADTFKDFNLALPTSRDEFRKLVMEVHNMGDSQLLARVLAVSSSFDELQVDLEELAESGDEAGEALKELREIMDGIARSFDDLYDSAYVTRLKAISLEFSNTIDKVIELNGTYADSIQVIRLALHTGLRAFDDEADSLESTFKSMAKTLSSSRRSIAFDLLKIQDPSLVAGANQQYLEGIVFSDKYDNSERISAASELQSLIMSNYEEQIGSVEDLGDLIGDIQGYINDLLLNETLSVLTPAQMLAESRSQFSAQLAMANAGDTDAISSIQENADTYLQKARDFYASGDQYTQIFGNVISALEAIELPDTEDYASITADATTQAVGQLELISEQLGLMQASNLSVFKSDMDIIQADTDRLRAEFLSQASATTGINSEYIERSITDTSSELGDDFIANNENLRKYIIANQDDPQLIRDQAEANNIPSWRIEGAMDWAKGAVNDMLDSLGIDKISSESSGIQTTQEPEYYNGANEQSVYQPTSNIRGLTRSELSTTEALLEGDKLIREFVIANQNNPQLIRDQASEHDIPAWRIEGVMGWASGAANELLSSLGLELMDDFNPSRANRTVEHLPVQESKTETQFDSLPMFAKGGVTSGISIAGEAGAEAVVPLPDGRTIPVDISGGSQSNEQLVSLVAQLVDEVATLRKEQNNQTSAIIDANYDANEINSESINTANKDNVESARWDNNKVEVV